MANDNVGVYEPGQHITCHATANVIGKRFVKISGNRTDGNIAVAHADAAGRVFGVTKYDADNGRKVGVMRGNGRVTFVKTAGAIAAFAEVEVGAAGHPRGLGDGLAGGYAVTAATSGADAEISLY